MANSNKHLSLSEASVVAQLIHSQGWQLLAQELKERFEYKYKKLRKSNRDSAFYKIQGYLDAIDEIFNIVDQNMNDIEGEE